MRSFIDELVSLLLLDYGYEIKKGKEKDTIIIPKKGDTVYGKFFVLKGLKYKIFEKIKEMKCKRIEVTKWIEGRNYIILIINAELEKGRIVENKYIEE